MNSLIAKSRYEIIHVNKPSDWARPGAYPRVEHLKFASFKYATALPANIRLGWKCSAGTNTLAYGAKSVNYSRKMFGNTGPCITFKLLALKKK